MTEELILYLENYGYFAIFSLIFLQEIGIPNPVPNEFVLMFSGYLGAVGILSWPLVFLFAILADFIGTSILFFIFYFFGGFILKKKPKWLPIKTIEKAKNLISKKDQINIFLGRLMPYLRGYVSVGAGLIQTKIFIFLRMVFLSAFVWSGGYVLIGLLIGKQWPQFIDKIQSGWTLFSIILTVIILSIILRHLIKYFLNNNKKIIN